MKRFRNIVGQVVVAARTPDRWQKIRPCDVILQVGDGGRNYTYQGRAYQSLFDSMGDFLTDRGLTVLTVSDFPGTRLTGINAHNDPISCNRELLFMMLKRKVIQLMAGKAKADDWFNRRGPIYLWCRIMEAAAPRCVIGNMPSPYLCRAGKMKGVPVYDLQHGVISDQHPWYGVKYRLEPAEDLVDGFLCWDETSAKTLRKWAPQKGIDVRVIGNPWFLRFMFQKPSDQLVNDALNRDRIANNKPTILISLQWGMDEFPDQVPNRVMVDALEKTILETADSYNWFIRLHQIQSTGKEKKMVHKYLERTFGHLDSVEWSKCSELPLPVLLKQVSLHITFYSSVVIEAGWMGVRTALLARELLPGGRFDKYFAYERDLGIASVLAQDVTAIKKWIEENINKEKAKSTLKDQRKALQAFIDEIASARVGKKLDTIHQPLSGYKN